MNARLSIVTVRNGKEVAWAEMSDGGEVTYSPYDDTGGEENVAASVIGLRMRQAGETEREAFHWLSRNGWSNGALMVAGIAGTDTT